jgi:2-keto-4-pentenoate hydratase
MTEPNLEDEIHDEIANELFAAARDAEPISPLRDRYALSIGDGYAISRRVLQHRLERGAEDDLVGYKIGFTSDAVREDLGVDEPAFGYVLDGMVSTGRATTTIDSKTFIAPRIEPEIAVVLGDFEDPLDERDAEAAIEAVVPAIEVVDSRIRDWEFTPPEAVADNALAAALLTGERHPWSADDIDLAGEGVTVAKDGTTVATGTGKAVLGDPIRALIWLAEELATREETLEPGQIVSTGSITRPVPVEPGEEITVEFDSLGTISLDIE